MTRRPATHAILLCLFLALGSSLHAQTDSIPSRMVGIQIAFDSIAKRYYAKKVLPGNAAAEAGVRDYDWLMAIDGKSLAALPLKDVAQMLRGGTAGAPYNLSIERMIKTTLGDKMQSRDFALTPRELAKGSCLTGNCIDGEGKYMNNLTSIAYEGTFENGQLVKGKTYYPSGRVREEGTFKDGKLHGPNGFYFYDQNLPNQYNWKLKGRFENGVLREGFVYTEDGSTWWGGTFDEQGKLHGKKVNRWGAQGYYEGPAVHGELTGKSGKKSK